ncbi:MAG TPA: right-handed parallel beta-helix repeat-containing protein [Candidatus Didemnitutus sp.]|nr:right-handed parallel beta-helix repeat-containing protein [Candidatus Didemnitutus sp.]
MKRIYSFLLGLMVVAGMLGFSSEAQSQYCRPQLQPGFWGQGITFFSLGTFSLSSPGGDYANQTGYSYYTARNIVAARNTPLTVQILTNAFSSKAYSIWIDLDQDGIFTAQERLLCALDNVFSTSPWTSSLTIPCTARTGITRLRVFFMSYQGVCPQDPCVFPGFVQGECEDYNIDIIGDFVSSFPDDTPENFNILPKGNIYDGSTTARPKPSMWLRAGRANQTFTIKYRMIGPLPITDTVYSADWTATGPSTGTFPATFVSSPTVASGPLAGAGGALNTTTAIGGEYTLLVESLGAANSCSNVYTRSFTIAVNRDIATRGIRSPQTNELPRRYKYPNTTPIPVEAIFQNSGLDTVKSFRGVAVLTGPLGTEVYRDTIVLNENVVPGGRLTQAFNNFIPFGGGHPVGLYKATVCAELITPFPDENPFNDCMPRPGSPEWIFEVGYNEEPAISSVTVPNGTQALFANRPFRPEAIYENNGIQDLSNVPVRLIVTRIGSGLVVYNQPGIVPDIAAGQFNKAIYTFPAFTPTEGGEYRFCFRVEYPGDPITTNNEICVDRTVQSNLAGVYTIGTTKPGPRNYLTIDAALNDLYLRGMSASVTFEFTDASYTQTSTGITNAAIDLSSRIIGLSSTNTLTFKPSLERSINKSSVTINMVTESGIGVLFGQNINPANINAIQRQTYFGNAQNANSAGYITFDGGAQKSLRFTMRKTVVPSFPSPFVSVFYLGSGSSNIQVKNCIINNADGVTPSYATSLPQVQFNSGSNQFRFEGNTRSTTISYTSGITQRDTINPDNLGNLDTLINTNNKFMNNEINGFGYGIVSIGIGTLIKAGINDFRAYYNAGTEISNNLIYNVRRAGIFAAYEDGVKITGNRIYNVGSATGGSEGDCAGIIAGGEVRYNNMNLNISRNEISSVRGNTWSRGIVVEQARNDFQSINSTNKGFGPRTQAGTVSFPNKPEHTYISSNAVWGLARGTTATNMAGIHLWTRRAASADPLTALVTPFIPTYFTLADSVVNNTIVIGNDNIVGTANIVGVGIQNANTPVIMNNAIALLGNANAAATTHSAIFYEGTVFRNGRVNTWYLPNTAPGALISDRNAFWTPNAGIARFVEISHTSELVSAGTQTEFASIAQWRNWTAQDVSSVLGDFVAEHVYLGVAPNQKLRVKVTPTPPIGSILNNRGARLAGTTMDIDGNARGQAGLGYDIGADEFDGRLFVSDLEVVDILKPGAYRDALGVTNDAEYIMTTAPVDVTARIQNNGAVSTTNSPIRVRVYLETAVSNNTNAVVPTWNATPVVDRVVTTALSSGQSKDVLFNIPAWTPQTYFGLPGYTVPTRFASTMINVTPRYRVEVTTSSDEFNPNNTYSKVVRFYLRKSTKRILVSARGSANDVLSGTPTQNEIVGRLNSDSVQKALGSLGYRNDPSNNIYDYDVFERNAWATRSVDYTMYHTMFWSHDQSALTRSERDDIRNFAAAGIPGNKKNLAISGQNLPAQHSGATVTSDINFIQRVLRAVNQAPGTPATPNYSGKRVDGGAIARGTTDFVSRTGFFGDAEPTPALVRIYSDPTTPGIANAAYSYRKGDRTTLDSIMGTATAAITTNTVYLGVDWRHYARTAPRTGVERIVRGIFDFFESNGGGLVPVELVDFDAKARGNDVDVFWSTVSEKNTDHFDVSRATLLSAKAGDMTSSSDFATISTIPASGSSTVRRDYAIKDADLAAGTYAYRLTAVDKDGARSASQEVNVTIGTDGNGLMLADVMPNPMVNDAKVSFTLASAGDVQLVLVNMAGQEVLTLVNASLAAGTHNATIEAGTLASGSYNLVLRSNGMIVSKNVTIAK